MATSAPEPAAAAAAAAPPAQQSVAVPLTQSEVLQESLKRLLDEATATLAAVKQARGGEYETLKAHRDELATEVAEMRGARKLFGWVVGLVGTILLALLGSIVVLLEFKGDATARLKSVEDTVKEAKTDSKDTNAKLESINTKLAVIEAKLPPTQTQVQSSPAPAQPAK